MEVRCEFSEYTNQDDVRDILLTATFRLYSVAQYVGCYSAKGFENVLLIDDDCALPPHFPIVSDRLTDMIKCIGYTIKSVGPPENPRGTLCQQAQDLEYKISGLQRAFAGKIGSATFPHGAISLWNTKFLIDTFRTHPGYIIFVVHVWNIN